MSTSATTDSHHFFHLSQQHQLQDMSHKRVALIKRPPLVRSFSPNMGQEGFQPTAFTNASLNNHHSKPMPKQKKSVRFCDNASLENVRLFLKTQMPKACRSDPSCLKNAFHVCRPNWPTSSSITTTTTTRKNAVRLEDIQLSKQRLQQQHITLFGSVQVANLAFQKKVIVRYTLDDWSTVQETEAYYQEPIAHSANTWDRFSFKITLNANTHTARHRHKSLYLVVKYTVSGRDFWDNNDQKNYQVDIVPDVVGDDAQDSDEDDDHLLEDCITTHEYHHHPALTMRWSPPPPPLSPTMPGGTTPPLWSNYFSAKTLKSTTTTTQEPTSNGNDTASQFHHLIHKYCFYNDHKKSSIFIPYHADPPRCSSPTLKAIRS